MIRHMAKAYNNGRIGGGTGWSGNPKKPIQLRILKGNMQTTVKRMKMSIFCVVHTTTKKGVLRKCNVPDGKSILLPIICFEHSLLEDTNVSNPHDLLGLATEDLRKYEVDKISAEINGKKYSTGDGIIRIRSPHFTMTMPKDNIWNTKEGFTFAAADGYWIFIRNLDPKLYDITINAQPSHSKKDSLEIDTSYKVTSCQPVDAQFSFFPLYFKAI